MDELNIIIEFVADAKKLGKQRRHDFPSVETLPKIDGVKYDLEYSPLFLTGLIDRTIPPNEFYNADARYLLDDSPENSSYIVRGTISEKHLSRIEESVKEMKVVRGIYSDPRIAPGMICPGDPPLGTDSDVERLLCTSMMRSVGMEGNGVLVAVVDTGVNLNYLASKGKTPSFDLHKSWSRSPSVTPGSAPVGHGTMCAFDVCIAAPKSTILDIALLHSTPQPAPGASIISGVLSDAVKAYSHLMDILREGLRLGMPYSLVVTNSWGVKHPSWDFPINHPGNYTSNPTHPFNVIVRALSIMGADIVFSAGNCGADCPSSSCSEEPYLPPLTTYTIRGANSSPFVTCVGGVDTTNQRVGYSSIGPGHLALNKPDICGYTHFQGSGAIGPSDNGTSAACPVVAGVIAALRSKKPYNPSDSTTSPWAIRSLITSTAVDLGSSGYDFKHGHGVINGCALAGRFNPLIEFCKRSPLLCHGFPNRFRNNPLFRDLAELAPSFRNLSLTNNLTDVEIAFLLGRSTKSEEDTETHNCGCKDQNQTADEE